MFQKLPVGVFDLVLKYTEFTDIITLLQCSKFLYRKLSGSKFWNQKRRELGIGSNYLLSTDSCKYLIKLATSGVHVSSDQAHPSAQSAQYVHNENYVDLDDFGLNRAVFPVNLNLLKSKILNYKSIEVFASFELSLALKDVISIV